MVCKPVHRLWVWLQQIMQNFFFPLLNLLKLYMHSSKPVHYVLSKEGGGEKTRIFKYIHAEAEWVRKTRRPFSSALIITAKNLR